MTRKDFVVGVMGFVAMVVGIVLAVSGYNDEPKKTPFTPASPTITSTGNRSGQTQ